jgi:hypothetical protein
MINSNYSNEYDKEAQNSRKTYENPNYVVLFTIMLKLF